MDIDKPFRIVFNNKYIRNNIFKFIRENNEFISKSEQKLVFKKYGQCNLKWCVRNKQFNLLLYKLSKEVNKRKEFTIDQFHYFLEQNTSLELLKQLFQIFPNLIPVNENEQSVIINKCSFGISTPSHLQCGQFVKKNINYKFKNKQEIIKYLMDEPFNIIPTKQTLNNLCIDGENIIMIKSMFDQGYYSISEDSDIGLIYCALKAQDYQFYKYIIENNPNLIQDQFQNMENYTLNLLLASTCNIDFYKCSFDELLKDEDTINAITNTNHKIQFQEPILFHINSTAIQYGSMEIIEYLCNNFHLYPKFHHGIVYCLILDTISKLKEDDGSGVSSLELLKLFLNHPKFQFETQLVQYYFTSFIENNKLVCLIYIKKMYGDSIVVGKNELCCLLKSECFNIETFKWLIGYNDGITIKVNYSVHTFNSIIQSLSLYPLLPYKSILDLILLDKNCEITDSDISAAITNYTFSTDSLDKHQYLCSFIKKDDLNPSFTH